jgi:Zn ribbon nucleic-acid-binding protein
MTKSTNSLVATCPDCGGILQPVALERLTSSEVASGTATSVLHLQCLLCGYEEDREDDEAVLPA